MNELRTLAFAGFFFTVSPPPAVTAGEYALIFVGIGYMLYGARVYAAEAQRRV